MPLSLGLPSCIQVFQTKLRVHSHNRSLIYANLQSPQLGRRSANFRPTIWHDYFIHSIKNGDELDQIGNAQRVCKLKNEASQMIYKEEPLRDKLELIDALQQLGVAYHFEEEINDVLTDIHVCQDLSAIMNSDLYLVSLFFRLLRTNGFSVPEDIFKNYFDDKGHCKSKLSLDIHGMLSLYEASYLAKEGEEILEMARRFTTKHLINYLESSNFNDSRMKEHVANALELPLNWRMERLHTRWFIDQYKTADPTRSALWELAVVDFNIIQDLYKKELKQASRWWTELRFYEKLPFIRDRLVENYLICVGTAFQPKHASYRIAETKANCLVTTIDDFYDVYGSLNELELFTDAIEQWDITLTEALPEYMQMCCLALFDTVESDAHDVLEKKGLNVTPILRRAWKDLCKAYLVEARWYHNGYVPTLEEYLDNGWVTIGANVFLSDAYCINDDVTATNLEQFSTGYPDIVRYSCTLARLYNDLATSSDELKRGDTKKSIQCYMHHENVTESVARGEIMDMIRKYWKLLNGAVLGNSAFHKYFKNACLNISRIAQCIYQHGDGYGKPDSETKDQVTLLLLDPIKSI
ncbi:Terpene synthase [Rhynchospora pubera]|uniref:Terpene synthase n=1 Tax=Rhynchospora pubera TaxID=906938 RepID=A0AAV8D263_9POAL|nr:Terpene synthase [Rhynchospora pubera]